MNIVNIENKILAAAAVLLMTLPAISSAAVSQPPVEPDTNDATSPPASGDSGMPRNDPICCRGGGTEAIPAQAGHAVQPGTPSNELEKPPEHLGTVGGGTGTPVGDTGTQNPAGHPNHQVVDRRAHKLDQAHENADRSQLKNAAARPKKGREMHRR